FTPRRDELLARRTERRAEIEAPRSGCTRVRS
ncbi:hypothetical protein, partial [Streptomyces sp. NPDC004230]